MCALCTRYTLWNWDDVNRRFGDFACVENEKGWCLLSSARKADQLQQERTCGQDSLLFYILWVSCFVTEHRIRLGKPPNVKWCHWNLTNSKNTNTCKICKALLSPGITRTCGHRMKQVFNVLTFSSVYVMPVKLKQSLQNHLILLIICFYTALFINGCLPLRTIMEMQCEVFLSKEMIAEYFGV